MASSEVSAKAATCSIPDASMASTMLRRINAESSISSTRKGGWPALSGEIESLLIALLRAMSAHGSLRDATH
jgi:hypothetical protein